MKYIVYKQPKDNIYPWEVNDRLFTQDGYVLSTISNENGNIFDWSKWEAVEISKEFAQGSLWCNCIIKSGQTERYRKWVPGDLDQEKPSLDSHLSGSSSADDEPNSLKYILNDEETTLGGEWNKFIMNRVVQDVFNNRFKALGVVDNDLERSTYQAQLAEAIAYLDNDSSPTPLLIILSENRNATVSELANSIINANDIYNTKVAELLAQQKAVQDQIKAVSGIDDTLLLKEDLLGVMVESGLAISSGRAEDDNRTMPDNKYGIQF